jgi:uncharacterized small protein (DUF1192 family)
MTFRKTAVSLLSGACAMAIAYTTAFSTYAEASVVTTESVVQKYAAYADKERLTSMLSRQDVRQELQKLGVNPDEAKQRIAALSDEEIRTLAERLDAEPAGEGTGAALIGAAVTVFIILLITDILCLTDVFGFTKCARR